MFRALTEPTAMCRCPLRLDPTAFAAAGSMAVLGPTADNANNLL